MSESVVAQPPVSSLPGGARPVRRQGDWFSTILVLAIVLVVGLLLSLAVYVVYKGILNPQPPRTAQEKQLQVLAQAVKDYPRSDVAWSDYAKALTLTGQYSAAERAIADGLARVPGSAAISLEKARLEYARGQLDKAYATAAAADKAIVDARQKKADELAQQGVVFTPTDAALRVDVLLMQGAVREQQKKWDDLVALTTAALSENPTSSDILVWRASAYAQLGKNDLAEKDLLLALQYSPDFVPAKQALQNLGKSVTP